MEKNYDSKEKVRPLALFEMMDGDPRLSTSYPHAPLISGFTSNGTYANPFHA
jgi:hypothetical protein